MAGGQPDSRGGEDGVGVDAGLVVADNDEPLRYSLCLNGVALSVTGEAVGGDDEGFLHRGEDGFDEHLLGVGLVETFGDNIGIGEDAGDVGGGEFEVMGDDVEGWIHAFEVFGGGVGFGAAELVGEIVLAVEVAWLDGVEIGDNERADAGAGKCGGDGRAEAPEAGDADG